MRGIGKNQSRHHGPDLRSSQIIKRWGHIRGRYGGVRKPSSPARRRTGFTRRSPNASYDGFDRSNMIVEARLSVISTKNNTNIRAVFPAKKRRRLPHPAQRSHLPHGVCLREAQSCQRLNGLVTTPTSFRQRPYARAGYFPDHRVPH